MHCRPKECFSVNWLFILGFATSSSLDNLGVGISYGIRGMRIPWISNAIIAVICFLFSWGGIQFGQWISAILPGILPVLLGAFVLFIIGIRIVLLTVPRHKSQPAAVSAAAGSTPSRNKLTDMLRHPEIADADQSGTIGYGEAVILGVALSANALTNGLSAGLLGLSPLAICITAAVGSYITVWWGVSIGRKAANIRIGSFSLGQFSTLISGVILLLIAVNALF
nr:sporulation membrane protein YtaF [Paenibacillus dendritiformis]